MGGGYVPAVMSMLLMINNSLLCPRRTLSSQRTMQAPPIIPNPMGRLRTPTSTGSCPYTLNDCVGQNIITEKKLAPEMKVMTNVKPRVRGSCFKRLGKMGYFAPYTSQKPNATRITNPRISGTRTWAEVQSYCGISAKARSIEGQLESKHLVASPLHAGHK